jgi:hypothetical protein
MCSPEADAMCSGLQSAAGTAEGGDFVDIDPVIMLRQNNHFIDCVFKEGNKIYPCGSPFY